MDVVVVLLVVALIVAAAGAYIYLAARKTRAAETERALPIPRVAGMKLRPLADSPAVFARTLVQPTVAPQPPPPASPAPSPLFDLDLEAAAETKPPPPPPVEIVWWKQFDGRSEALDDIARLRLIGDLGVVAKEWCVPLLVAAYTEERRPGHRQAALIALAACRSRAAAVAFRAAMTSGDAAERSIATDGLADLEPAPQSTLRRTVERH